MFNAFITHDLCTGNYFAFTIKTDNLSAGSTTNTQFKLPLVSGGTYDFIVNWGDGTQNTITTWNSLATTHTYSSIGTYTVTIRGTITGWQFNNTGDRLKLLSISKWGQFKTGNQIGAFYGCANLNLTAVQDVLDLTGITILNGLFRDCSTLTTINRVIDWNTSLITDMSNMFFGATNFNQNIGSWNVGSVTTFNNMFRQSNFNNGGSSDINNWSIKTTGAVSFGNMFLNNPIFNQNIGSWNTSAVTNMAYMFNNATNFNQNIGSWNTTNVTNMDSMFRSATAFNQNIGSWNVSNVTNMAYMFNNATNFNQNIGSWNTTNVTNMDSMFRSATAFNQNIGSWNVSNVTTMADMFFGATNFNQDLGSWNVFKVTTFAQMFQSATNFNNGGSSDINNWSIKTTGSVLLNAMFRSAPAFNQNIGSWNTSAVTNMNAMFFGATAFNQNIGSWNTTNVINMNAMFYSATNFNQNIGSWNTTNVINMNAMFYSATNFNQNIGSWNIDSVTTLTEFMAVKTDLNYSTTNMDSILNGWILNELSPSKITSFGTIKRTVAGTEGYNLLTRTNTTKTVTNAVNNGVGLIRITAVGHGLSTGNKCFVKSVTGTTEANGLATITVIDPDTFDIDGSTFTNTYISGGTVITGYGWTITGATL